LAFCVTLSNAPTGVTLWVIFQLCVLHHHETFAPTPSMFLDPREQ